MIFATTGTQLPFPRLIEALDRLAPELGERVVAQVGPDPAPRRAIECHATLTPPEFERLFREARLVVAHAGIGSILSAKQWGRPLVLVPRSHAMGEHRNDHQTATAREMESRSGFRVVWDLAELGPVLAGPAFPPPEPGAGGSAAELIDRVRRFVDA